MNKEQEIIYNKSFTKYFMLLDCKVINNNLINLTIIDNHKYRISINNKTIQCSCKYSYKLSKNDILCEHCCFILQKVFNINEKFFNTCVFTHNEFKSILSKSKELDIKNNNLKNNTYKSKYRELLLSFNKRDNYDRKLNLIDDKLCNICFDYFIDKSLDFQCPVCNNLVHKECLNKLREYNKKECIKCNQDMSIFMKYM